MNRKFVSVVADIYCDWEGNPPNYRVWVENELFGERTYIWKDEYLEELVQIFAEPGKYTLRWELVPPFTGKIHAKNLQIKDGNARLVKHTLIIESDIAKGIDAST